MAFDRASRALNRVLIGFRGSRAFVPLDKFPASGSHEAAARMFPDGGGRPTTWPERESRWPGKTTRWHFLWASLGITGSSLRFLSIGSHISLRWDRVACGKDIYLFTIHSLARGSGGLATMHVPRKTTAICPNKLSTLILNAHPGAHDLLSASVRCVGMCPPNHHFPYFNTPTHFGHSSHPLLRTPP